MRVRIYQPSKTAMQSGRAKIDKWLIEPELETARTPEPLMGWVSAGDTLIELLNKLRFNTQDEAIAFAQRKGWEYSVTATEVRKVTPRSYADNFRYVKPGSEDNRQ
jgi:hypothetical protein